MICQAIKSNLSTVDSNSSSVDPTFDLLIYLLIFWSNIWSIDLTFDLLIQLLISSFNFWSADLTFDLLISYNIISFSFLLTPSRLHYICSSIFWSFLTSDLPMYKSIFSSVFNLLIQLLICWFYLIYHSIKNLQVMQ